MAPGRVLAGSRLSGDYPTRPNPKYELPYFRVPEIFRVKSGTQLQVLENILMLLELHGEHSKSLEKPAGIFYSTRSQGGGHETTHVQWTTLLFEKSFSASQATKSTAMLEKSFNASQTLALHHDEIAKMNNVEWKYNTMIHNLINMLGT